MSQALLDRIRQSKPLPPERAAVLHLLLAAEALKARLDQACLPFEITQNQFNILRILRGSGPEGHPEAELDARRIERAGPLNTVLEPLLARGLITSEGGHFQISEEGAALLEQVNPAAEQARTSFAARFTTSEMAQLCHLLERVWATPRAAHR